LAEVSAAANNRISHFEEIYESNSWGNSESRSGPGSTLRYTERVRKLLDLAIETFRIDYFVDAPCGDCNWQPHLENFPSINYTGIDIVGQVVLANGRKYRDLENAKFLNLDLVLDYLPQGDMILARDAIQHLSLADGLQVLRNIEASGAKFLVTNFHHSKHTGEAFSNRNIESGGYYPINVMLPPFNFPKPLFYIMDGDDESFENDEIKFAGVWQLPVVDKGAGQAFPVDFEQSRNVVHMHNN